MQKVLLLFIAICATAISGRAQDSSAAEAEQIRAFYNRALSDQQGYHWLRELTAIGPRPAGSPEADSAVQRFQQICDSLGLRTQLQRVRVPRWIRGEVAQAAFYRKDQERQAMNMCALGGSVPTPAGGLRAQAIEITDFDQLDSLDLSGKIAFFNIPMDPTFIRTGFAYGRAVKQRWIGAVRASERGADGVLIRSLSSSINPHPHTGSMTYEGAERKIPAAAISTRDAEALSRALAQDPERLVYFEQNCRWEDSLYSHNLIADLPGSEKPDEYILVGGHIDSWELGTGAHDDGAGCVHALEALHLIQRERGQLKRSLRVVFFMNEEFGLDGAKTYARKSREKGWRHALAFESDGGGFSPRGVTIDAPDSIVKAIKAFRPLLEPYGIHRFSQNGSGADVKQLKDSQTILMGLRPDSHRYFEIHHAATDVLENVNARELSMGSATIASFLYLLDRHDISLHR